MPTTHLSADQGELRLHTAVAGSAARMGHNLVIEVAEWDFSVSLTSTASGPAPERVDLTANLPSLRVVSGSGGVRPLTEADRETIVRNALKVLRADEFPLVHFASDRISSTSQGYVVGGELTIAGRARHISCPVRLSADGRSAECAVDVAQPDYGLKPYSTMMGQLRVADIVRVTFSVRLADPPA